MGRTLTFASVLIVLAMATWNIRAQEPAATKPAGDSLEKMSDDLLECARDFNGWLATVASEEEAKKGAKDLEKIIQRYEAIVPRAKAMETPTREKAIELDQTYRPRFEFENTVTAGHLQRLSAARGTVNVVRPAWERIGRAVSAISAAGNRKIVVRAPAPGTGGKFAIPQAIEGQPIGASLAESAAAMVKKFGEDKVATIEIVGIPDRARGLSAKVKSLAKAVGASESAYVSGPSGSNTMHAYLAVAPVENLQIASQQVNQAGIVGSVQNIDSQRRSLRVIAEARLFDRTNAISDNEFLEEELPAGMKRIVIPQKELDVAAIPSTGVVAAVDPAREGVRFYPKLLIDGSPDGVIERKVGDKPCSVVHKPLPGGKGAVLVLCAGDKTVHVLDDVKFEPIAVVELAQELPIKLAVSQSPNDRVAYYASAKQDGHIGHFSLETFKDLGVIDPREDDNDLAVSADGTMLYTRQSNVGPSGINVYALAPPLAPDQPVRVQRVADHHHDSHIYRPDPFNQFVASGATLYPYDIPTEKEVAKLPGVPLAYLREKPVIVTEDMGTISTVSANTLALIGEVQIPLQLATASTRSNDGPKFESFIDGRFNAQYLGEMLADEKRGNLLAWRGNKGILIPLTSLKLGDEPNLGIELEGDKNIIVGQTLTLSATARDKAAKLSLFGAPTGMTIAGGKIAWKPVGGQVGIYPATIRVTSGKLQREHRFTVRLDRPSLRLDFEPNLLVVSPDGKRLLAARTEPDHRTGQRRENVCRIVLIDVATLKPIVDRMVEAGCQTLALDGEYVYASLKDSNAFFVLSGKDLSDVKRVFTEQRVQAFQPVGNKFVFVKSYNDRGGPVVLGVPDLEPAVVFERKPNEMGNLGNIYYGFDAGNPTPLLDGWFYEGIVFDDALAKVKMLVQPVGFPAVVGVAAPNADRMSGRNGQSPLGVWGNVLGNRRQLGQINRGTSAVLVDKPAFVTLDEPPQNNSGERIGTVKWTLTTYDLLTASPVGTLALAGVPRAAMQNVGEKRITAGPGVVVAMVGQTLWTVPTSELAEPKTTPLTFAQELPTLVMDPTKPTVITPKLRGGKPPYKFSLPIQHPAVDIDPATGKLTIRPEELKLDESAQSVLVSSRSNAHTRPASLDDGAAKLMKAMTPRFKQLTGREPKGVPIAVQFAINATDAEQQSASLEFALFAEVPLAPIVKKLADNDAEQVRRQQEYQANMKHQQEQAVARPTTRPSEDASVDALKGRITELENRNRQLEAQVELLKDLVKSNQSGKRSKAQTRPK